MSRNNGITIARCRLSSRNWLVAADRLFVFQQRVKLVQQRQGKLPEQSGDLHGRPVRTALKEAVLPVPEVAAQHRLQEEVEGGGSDVTVLKAEQKSDCLVNWEAVEGVRPEQFQRRLDKLVWRSPVHSGSPPHLLSRKTTIPNSPSASTPGPGMPVNTCKQTTLAYRSRQMALIKSLPPGEGPSSDSLNWTPEKARGL